MSERDDDNVENGVKCNNLNAVIKRVHRCMAPDCVI